MVMNYSDGYDVVMVLMDLCSEGDEGWWVRNALEEEEAHRKLDKDRVQRMMSQQSVLWCRLLCGTKG